MTRRIPAWLLMLAMVAAACSNGGADPVDEPPPTTTEAPVTTPPGTSPPGTGQPPQTTGPTTPTTTTVTTQPQEPEPEPPAPLAVVLVEAETALNVRSGPGAEFAVVGSLSAGQSGIVATGAREESDGLWLEIEVRGGTGWISSEFVTEEVSEEDFLADQRIDQLLEALVVAFDHKGDLVPLASPKGLYATHFGDVHHYPTDVLAGLLGDTKVRNWAGTDCSRCVAGTFASILSPRRVYGDPDQIAARNQYLAGPNPTAGIPAKLADFHYLSILDPGDDPGAAGLDWQTMVFYFDYIGGEPRLVGLSVDAWSP